MKPRSRRLELVSIAAAIGSLVACMSPLPITIEPVAAPYDPQTGPIIPDPWFGRVYEAVVIWNTALPECGEAFNIGSPGLRVKLYTRDWPADADVTSFHTDDEIGIRQTGAEYERVLLVHELGHALGLDHSTGDPFSVMRAAVSAQHFLPTERDKENARGLLGCAR